LLLLTICIFETVDCKLYNIIISTVFSPPNSSILHIVLSLGMVKNSLSISLLYYDRLQSCQLFLQDMSNSVHFLPKCQISKFQIMVQFNINY